MLSFMGTRWFSVSKYRQATQLCSGSPDGAESPCFLCGVLVAADVSSAVQSFSFFGVVDGRRQRRDKNFSRTRSLRDPSATRRRILRLMHSDVGEKLRTDGQQDNQSIPPVLIIQTRQTTGLFSPFPDLANQSVTRTDVHQRQQHQRQRSCISPPR